MDSMNVDTESIRYMSQTVNLDRDTGSQSDTQSGTERVVLLIYI